jgi:hypothetical protein
MQQGGAIAALHQRFEFAAWNGGVPPRRFDLFLDMIVVQGNRLLDRAVKMIIAFGFGGHFIFLSYEEDFLCNFSSLGKTIVLDNTPSI